MNLAEALLAADAGKITRKATKQIEIPRLTEQFGVPFILDLKQIPYRRIREIQDNATKINKDKTISVSNGEIYMALLCDGIANKDFDQLEVLKHFGCATRKDLFAKIFLPGEIQGIADEISQLCGYSTKNIQELTESVKN